MKQESNEEKCVIPKIKREKLQLVLFYSFIGIGCTSLLIGGFVASKLSCLCGPFLGFAYWSFQMALNLTRDVEERISIYEVFLSLKRDYRNEGVSDDE